MSVEAMQRERIADALHRIAEQNDDALELRMAEHDWAVDFALNQLKPGDQSAHVLDADRGYRRVIIDVRARIEARRR